MFKQYRNCTVNGRFFESKGISPGKSKFVRFIFRVDSLLCGTSELFMGVSGNAPVGLGCPEWGVVVSACRLTPFLYSESLHNERDMYISVIP